MKKKEIQICGKTVHLAYCYATEIAYKDLAAEDINDYMPEAIDALQDNRMPDIKKTIFLILASMMSYYNSIGEESPVKDMDLMNEATPMEIGEAIGTIISLRVEFYHVPVAEPKDKEPKGKKKKNS